MQGTTPNQQSHTSHGMFCTLLSALVQLIVAFCLYFVFLAGKIMHKQMQSKCYVQIVPQCISRTGTNSHFQNMRYCRTECATICRSIWKERWWGQWLRLHGKVSRVGLSPQISRTLYRSPALCFVTIIKRETMSLRLARVATWEGLDGQLIRLAALWVGLGFSSYSRSPICCQRGSRLPRGKGVSCSLI